MSNANTLQTKSGWVLAILTMLTAINSTYFFLGVGKTGVYPWLMMNSCAPSILLFFIGYILANPVILGIGAAMMFRYGTLGLFIFSWQGPNLIAQVGHIFMTLSVIFVVWRLQKTREWKKFLIGVVIGAIILVGYGILQHLYFSEHPEVLEQLFHGEW